MIFLQIQMKDCFSDKILKIQNISNKLKIYTLNQKANYISMTDFHVN